MDEGGRPRTGTRLPVPVDREGLRAQSDVQREEITNEAAGAWRWHGMSQHGPFDFASGVQNDVVKLPAGAVQREANHNGQSLSSSVSVGLSGRSASTTCYVAES